MTAARVADPGRWVRLTLSLRDAASGEAGGGLTHAVPFSCQIEPLDELAAEYDLENWESGLLSGYFFACRRSGRLPPPPVRVSELAGALRAEDMGGVVRAAEAAAAYLFGNAYPADEREWRAVVTSAVPLPAVG